MRAFERVILILILVTSLASIGVMLTLQGRTDGPLRVTVRPTGNEAIRELYLDCGGQRMAYYYVSRDATQRTARRIYRTPCRAHGELMDGTAIESLSGTSQGAEVKSVLIQVNDEGKCHFYFDADPQA